MTGVGVVATRRSLDALPDFFNSRTGTPAGTGDRAKEETMAEAGAPEYDVIAWHA
jgi:hypothetical protein